MRVPFAVYYSPLAVLLVFVAIDARKKIMHKVFHTDFSTPLSQCVDKFIERTGAKHGIAQYWHSKQLHVLSRHNITLAQLNGSLRPYRWITSESWYREKYDFALIDYAASQPAYKLSAYEIITKNGEPDEIYHCGQTKILYYKQKFAID